MYVHRIKNGTGNIRFVIERTVETEHGRWYNGVSLPIGKEAGKYAILLAPGAWIQSPPYWDDICRPLTSGSVLSEIMPEPGVGMI